MVQVLRSHIALLLLLCLTRTLLPEAWILALHPHAHAVAEPAQTLAAAHKGRALLSAQHQHCEVEQFYNAAFQLGVPLALPLPRAVRRYATLAAPLAVRAVAGCLIRPAALRGPPSGA
ncbi:MAG TPA: hypothetical protein VF630_13925 [Hymenobacter sp.]|jgi:hypothetical protein